MAQIQSITLTPPQVGYIPSNATIMSVEGTAVATSNCFNLQSLPTSCWRFVWEVEPSFSNAFFTGIDIEGIYYDFNSDPGYSDASNLYYAISTSVPNGLVSDPGTSTNGEERVLTFRLPGSITKAPIIYFSNPSASYTGLGAVIGEKYNC